MARESSLYFYNNAPVLNDLSDIRNATNFKEAPVDWLVVTADVKGSTQLALEGRYKDVNVVSAALITAVLNVVQKIEIPFVFGGDGASFLIPKKLSKQVANILADTTYMAMQKFNIELRVGIIPIKDVYKAALEIKVAKIKLHNRYSQAVFIGGGLSYAEELLKTTDLYSIEPNFTSLADFSGFECRWNKVNTHKDETISLLIKAVDSTNLDLYNKILQKISDIYGNKTNRHPINVNKLNLSFRPSQLRADALVTKGHSRVATLIKLLGLNVFVTGWSSFVRGNTFLSIISRKVFNLDWQEYKEAVLLASDNEKFDDILRMIISSTIAQRVRLIKYLESLQKSGQIVYGYHSSKATLITCVVFNRVDYHMHFIDGADGGYTYAAKLMKEQIKKTNHSKE